MEKPILRTILILTGILTFSISALSSAPARCLALQDSDHKAFCLAKAQLDVKRCDAISNPQLLQQCQTLTPATY
jgi:hypothetical protein